MKTCASCKYAVEDMTTKGREEVDGRVQNWVGIECSNPDSDYYLALLNITSRGNAQAKITWKGCEYHKEKRQVAKFEGIPQSSI